ncbi:MAG: VWA domain-containing protein [Caldilineaceae bacterium]
MPTAFPLTRRFRLLHLIICMAMLLPLTTNTASAAPTAAPQAAQPQETNACPASPSGLPNSIERTDFCVFYDQGQVTQAQATTVADHVQNYWNRYVNDFGFQVPMHSGKLEVEILNNSGCNGSTTSADNEMNMWRGCFGTAESAQKVPGHELFHRVQFSYDTNFAANWWMTEGTARAMEDLAFDNIDNWPTSLTAVSSSFNKQVNEYLNNTNVDITSQPQRYNSALWWKYFTEQYGTINTEPQRGVDAMLKLWQAAATQDDIAAVNTALGNLGAGVNFDAAFRRFAAANWIKDLTNQPSTAYNYIDEDQVGNPAAYGPIFPTNGGTINSATTATFSNQSLSRYGARYYAITPSSTDCPLVSATFHTDSGPAFYHVISQKGNAVDHFSSSTATDWTQAFFNDGVTKIMAIAGATNAAAQSDITVACVNPVVDIKLPNSGAVAHVGAHDAPGKFLAQVLVTNGNPKGPVVSGLTISDFKAKVNGQNALITAGGFIQEQYWLVVQAPNQTADGTYDLEITLEKSGTSTAIASDTNTASVTYIADHTDHLLVLDRSGSMASDNKMLAAKAAASFYIDITRNNDGLGVAAFNEDLNPAPFTLRAVTAAPNVRQDAKNYINGISASGATSIGDGMRSAVNQRNATPTGNPLCSFVLLSDGMENSAEFWSTVQTDAIATHCPVTTIAFGPETDETLLQNIATATGGLFFYNDVFVSSANAADANSTDAFVDTTLSLGNTYEYAQAESEGRQRMIAEKGALQFETIPLAASVAVTQVHQVMVDDSVTEMLFALNWGVDQRQLELKLRKPDGTIIDHNTLPYDFVDYNYGHLGWRIANPDPGMWEMLVDFQPFEGPFAANASAAPAGTNPSVPYQVIGSGKTNLTMNLLLPDQLGSRYLTGNRVPIYAFVSGQAPLGGLAPYALVTAPDGVQSKVLLFDDGQHGDGEANDGFYGGVYTLVTQAKSVAPTGEEGNQPKPNNEGSYQVRLVVQTQKFTREALGSFSVKAGDDSNSNGLPDPFEQENQVTSDDGDPDLDGLDNISEYQLGTDPNNSDSDGGGENDGSEFTKGKNPLDPTDDSIVAPQFLHVTPNVGMNVVQYDVQSDYNRMVLYRATSPNGPWNIEEPELPNTGIYSDTADNGVTYFYRFMGINANDNRSRIIGSSSVVASEDPFQPEVDVVINNDATETSNLNVVLNFVPYAEEGVMPADVTEMRISNDPTLSDADWEPFSQNKAWQLAPTQPGEIAKVYAQVRDAAHNESLIVLDDIKVSDGQGASTNVYLPIVVR